MARRRRYRRYGGGGRRRGRGRGRGLPKLFDISQGVTNAAYLGFFVAGQQAVDGQYIEAANTLVDRATSMQNTFKLTMANALIGFNRKLARSFGGRIVRKWIA